MYKLQEQGAEDLMLHSYGSGSLVISFAYLLAVVPENSNRILRLRKHGGR